MNSLEAFKMNNSKDLLTEETHSIHASKKAIFHVSQAVKSFLPLNRSSCLTQFINFIKRSSFIGVILTVVF